MLNAIAQGTNRIFKIVKAVKVYSYRDRAPLQDVNLHEGFDNTLIILGYKLKSCCVIVIREYEQNLPRIPAHGSALNQVWTNLIDNAIDAVGEGVRFGYVR